MNAHQRRVMTRRAARLFRSCGNENLARRVEGRPARARTAPCIIDASAFWAWKETQPAKQACIQRIDHFFRGDEP